MADLGSSNIHGSLSVLGRLNSNGDLVVNGIIQNYGDTDTYMQFHGADEWRVVAGGFERIVVNNSGLTINNSLYVPSAIYHTGDTDTYMQFHAADQWRVVTGGVERIAVNNSGLYINNSLYVTSAICHTGDTDTYMQFHAANEWRVVAGGTERLAVNASYTIIDNALLFRNSNHRPGLLENVGNGTTSWTGYQITSGNGQRWSWMGDDITVGWYNEIDGKWACRYHVTGYWIFYAYGADKLRLNKFDVTVFDDLLPSTGSSYDLGSSTLAWAEGHFDTLYQGGEKVVESGSNADGSWVKFADGTMIQWGIKEGYNNGPFDPQEGDYPVAFVGSNPNVQAVGVKQGGTSSYVAPLVVYDVNPLTRWRVFMGGAGNPQVDTNWFAIGRWYT